jgi:Na+/proline symporter
MVVVFGVIAYIVTRTFADSTGFFEKALFAFTIYGASITPSVVAAIVWPKATKAGSVSSILVGVIIALAWNQPAFLEFLKNTESLKGLNGLDAVLPAIFMSVLCLIVVSLLTQKKTEKTETPTEGE